MAVDNTTLMIIIALFFNYFLLYKRNKFFGNVMYIGISIMVMYHGVTLSATEDVFIMTGIGLAMFLGSSINTIYDWVYNDSNTNSRGITT